jgi:hypothetical protein
LKFQRSSANCFAGKATHLRDTKGSGNGTPNEGVRRVAPILKTFMTEIG